MYASQRTTARDKGGHSYPPAWRRKAISTHSYIFVPQQEEHVMLMLEAAMHFPAGGYRSKWKGKKWQSRAARV